MVSAVKEITEADILDAIKAHASKYRTKKEAADSLGVSRVFLWKVLEGKVPPTNPMLETLGYKRERTITYIYKKLH